MIINDPKVYTFSPESTKTIFILGSVHGNEPAGTKACYKLIDYFKRKSLVMELRQPLELVEFDNKYDIFINANGGGLSGQAGASVLGISRSLINIDSNFRSALKNAGFLTRDSRIVERKKYGQPGARKKFQFSKR